MKRPRPCHSDCPKEEAYKAVSLNAAQIFGIGNRLGSIEEGKTADLIVSDGNPLEVMTHIDLMFINGKACQSGQPAERAVREVSGNLKEYQFRERTSSGGETLKHVVYVPQNLAAGPQIPAGRLPARQLRRVHHARKDSARKAACNGGTNTTATCSRSPPSWLRRREEPADGPAKRGARRSSRSSTGCWRSFPLTGSAST
jgi:hypothetical protein